MAPYESVFLWPRVVRALRVGFRWHASDRFVGCPMRPQVVHVWYMFQRQQVMATNALQPNEHQPLTQQKKEPLPAA